MRLRSIWCSSSSTSNFTREPVVALLGSPHFSFEIDGTPIRRSDVAALNRALSDEGYFGGVENLRAFERWKAAQAAVAAAGELRALAEKARPSVQLDALLAFLDAHDRIPTIGDPLRERHLRARRAVLSAIHGLRRAHQYLDDSPIELSSVAAMIRRWIEGQTFAPRAGHAGVQLLDAQAARYGEFDEVFLVGLVEGEWPQRSSKSIFYPASLLEPARLARLARDAGRRARRISGSDGAGAAAGAPVDVRARKRLDHRSERVSRRCRSAWVSHGTCRRLEPTAACSCTKRSRAIRSSRRRLKAKHRRGSPCERRDRKPRPDRFHGTAASYKPAAYSVSSLERYLQCPFQFFSERVLRLEEDPEDEATLNPKELGIFVHEVFQKFFEEWNRQGHLGITPENLPQARAMFSEVIEPLLATLPEDEAAVQRTRLLGSAADEGLAEAVFQVEAEWETPVVERLLEHSLNGEFEIRSETETRRVALRGKADRIDLLQDHTFRIIDYKLSRAPDRKLALQLPVYTVCTMQHLRADPRRGLGAGPGRLYRLWPGSAVRPDAGARQVPRHHEPITTNGPVRTPSTA